MVRFGRYLLLVALLAAILAGCSKPPPAKPVVQTTGPGASTTRGAAFQENQNIPEYLRNRVGGRAKGPAQ